MSGSFFSRGGLTNSNVAHSLPSVRSKKNLIPPQRYGCCWPRVLLDILDVQEILSNDQVWRLLVVLGELTYCSDVRFLSFARRNLAVEDTPFSFEVQSLHLLFELINRSGSI